MEYTGNTHAKGARRRVGVGGITQSGGTQTGRADAAASYYFHLIC